MSLTALHGQTLEVHLLAWNPATAGRPLEADAVVPPASDSAALLRWLGSVRDKFVLISPPEPMCRAPQELERYARPATVQRIAEERRLQEAGAAGLVTSTWSNGWGVNKIFGAQADCIPSVDLSCEDYGLVWRLASNHQGPRLRLTADAEARPD